MAATHFSKRRAFLIAGAASAAVMSPPGRADTARRARIKAVALDGFTTFDPRPVAALAERLFPGQGAELMNAWRTRQFEYTWLRTLTRSYVDFARVTEDALVFAARSLKLDLAADRRAALMQSFRSLAAWPDALPALQRMKKSGLRLAFLANPPAALLDAWVRNAGLDGLFEPHLSTDRVRAFKPDPRAYQMGVDGFGLGREEIIFAAFGGWDAVGAKAFGYPTFWVNRAGAPAEELGFAADGAGATLEDLADFLALRV